MQAKTKQTWQKRFQRFFLVLGIVCLCLVVIAYCVEGIIGKKIIAEVQNNLKTEIKVEDVSFSLIRSFPYASLDLQNTTIQGTDKQNLLKAGVLRLKINIWSLFSEPLKIKAVVIQNGALLLKTNAAGKTNYDISKPSKSEGSGVSFLLEKATLKNIVLGYQNQKTQQDLGATIKNASFAGAFSDEKFILESSANIVCHGYSAKGVSFLTEKNILYDADLQIDRIKGLYTINTFDLGIEENKFDIKGKILQLKSANNLDLTFNATHCDIASLLEIFPQPFLQDFHSAGDFVLKGAVKGIYSNDSYPNIKADMQLRNGSVSSPRLNDALEKVNFTASLRFNDKESFFNMPNFKGYFGNQPLTMSLDVKDLKAPFIDFKLDGKIPLSSTYNLLNNPDINDANGFLALKNIQVSGNLEDMKKVSSIGKVEMSGALIAEEVALQIKKESVAVPSGALRFANNTIFIEKIRLDAAGSQILFDGNFHNLLPVVLDDSLHRDATLDFRAQLFANQLDIKRFTALFQTPNTNQKAVAKKENTTQKSQQRPLISMLNGVFEAQIEQFSYDKIKGSDFEGFLGFEQDNLLLKGRVNTMGGTMNLNGRLAMQGNPNLSAIVACSDFDTKTFFAQCKNFGQDVLKTDNVSGKLSTKLAIDAYWDKNWNFKDKDLFVLAYLNVKDGYMQNVKMLEDFSTYVKIEDLRNIKFTNLENWFQISNSTLRIPVMTLRNNALNMTISGTHSFDDKINYNFKINAANVVVSRFKKFNPRLEPQEDVERNGFLDLFFNMAGTMDNYKIQMSKKIVKADFDESAKLKREIQAKLDAAENGKDFQMSDNQYIETQVFSTPKNKTNPSTPTKKTKKKEDEYEYIEGF